MKAGRTKSISSKNLARRIDAVRHHIEAVTGKRLSKREIREYLREQGRRMWQKELGN